MATIIRGTTPSITYKFDTVSAADIKAAYLTIVCNGTTVERDISTAVAGDDSLTWTLSQDETLSLTAGMTAKIRCNWKLADGTRGASKREDALIEENEKAEVI